MPCLVVVHTDAHFPDQLTDPNIIKASEQMFYNIQMDSRVEHMTFQPSRSLPGEYKLTILLENQADWDALKSELNNDPYVQAEEAWNNANGFPNPVHHVYNF
jgi:hypothetical protein